MRAERPPTCLYMSANRRTASAVTAAVNPLPWSMTMADNRDNPTRKPQSGKPEQKISDLPDKQVSSAKEQQVKGGIAKKFEADET